jgi:hypothetical protein
VAIRLRWSDNSRHGWFNRRLPLDRLAIAEICRIGAGKLATLHARRAHPWAKKYLYDHVDGTGPFTVERWDHNQQVIFVKNPTYWGLPDRPKLDRAVFGVSLGHATQPQGVMARGTPFHDDTPPMPQKDIATAKQLLIVRVSGEFGRQ